VQQCAVILALQGKQDKRSLASCCLAAASLRQCAHRWQGLLLCFRADYHMPILLFSVIVLALQGKQDKSCKLLCGGERVGKKGFYFAPTAFEVTDNNAKIAQEEIFGPVQCIFKWNDMEQVGTAYYFKYVIRMKVS
jgi:hypothetical protein